MTDRLLTERLVLRRARSEDEAAMHTIFTDPVAMRYWSRPPHSDIEETHDWIRSMIEVDPALSDDFIVTLNGRCIGKMGAWRLPEFGFILASAHWGKGYASEALAAFVAHRRSVAPGSTLEADVDPRNAASLGLLAKHGFVEIGRAEGTWQVGEELCDSVYLKLAL